MKKISEYSTLEKVLFGIGTLGIINTFSGLVSFIFTYILLLLFGNFQSSSTIIGIFNVTLNLCGTVLIISIFVWAFRNIFRKTENEK